MKSPNCKVIAAGLVATLLMVATVSAAPRGPRHDQVFDQRYGHNRYYPGWGNHVTRLPPRYATFHYRGNPWYRSGGVWYRPVGPRFVVMAPPIGITVPVLPRFYTTVWFGGAPYYYADHVYYRWVPQQNVYIVTDPPGDPDAAATAAPDTGNQYVYPARNQSPAQQTEDRYACYQWARGQTGYDPTQPLGGVPAREADSRHDEYLKAEDACLEGRGYTVR